MSEPQPATTTLPMAATLQTPVGPRPCSTPWILMTISRHMMATPSLGLPLLHSITLKPWNSPPKTYPEADQGSLPSPPYAAVRSYESFNQSNWSITIWYVLLYINSAVGVFSNASLLYNICQDGRTLPLICNAVTVTITLCWDLKGYRTAWYHPKDISNILLLAWVKNIYRFSYNSTKGYWFTDHKGGGGTKLFMEPPWGLY